MSDEANAVPSSFPSEPIDLIAIGGGSYVNISWNAPVSSGGSPITNYRIYRDTTSGGETFYIEIGNITYYNDTSVSIGTTYYYKVSAVNIIGEGPMSDEANAKPGNFPSSPIDLSASAGLSYVDLIWGAPASDGGSPIINYKIYRGTTSGGETFLIQIGDVLSYNDTSVINGITYYYKVSAVNTNGEGSLSTEASATPGSVPSAPLDLNTTVGSSFINLTWSTPSSDGGSTILGYYIYRNGTLIGTIAADQRWYNDTAVLTGIPYIYNVSAYNVIGEGLKPSLSATPKTIPSEPRKLQVKEGNSYANLTWDIPLSDGGSEVIGYHIYRNGTLIDTVSADQRWYNDTNVVNGINYTYKVSAYNDVGEGEKPSTSAIPKTTPSEPQNLQDTPGSGYVNLTWDPPSSDGGSEIINYIIYRSEISGEEEFLAEIGNLLYHNDTAVTNGITYYYKVSARNVVGEGSRSNEVNATPFVAGNQIPTCTVYYPKANVTLTDSIDIYGSASDW